MGHAGGQQRPHPREVTMALYKGLELRVVPTDSEHRGYYEAARQGRLVVQRCSACGRLRGVIGSSCPFCTSGEWTWHDVSGRGVIYSYEIVTQAIQPAFQDWVPYPIVLVTLDEQRDLPWRWGLEDEAVSVRLITNLVRRDDPTRPEAEDAVAIGERVEVCFVELSDDMALPQFRLSDEPPEHDPWRAP
jgi:uncharacterized OB-fold protein